MEVTYQITPEMVGLNWRRVLSYGLRSIALALLSGLVAAKVLHGRFLIGGAIGLAGGALLSALLLRPLSRTRLRITDDSIEELDGPLIRKDAIARVNEYAAPSCPDIEIVGRTRPQWLRKYHIFVPAALPQYPEVRRMVQGWTDPQHWHTV